MSASDVFTGAAICFVRQLEIIPDRTGINGRYCEYRTEPLAAAYGLKMT